VAGLLAGRAWHDKGRFEHAELSWPQLSWPKLKIHWSLAYNKTHGECISPKGDKVMKRLINYLLVVLVALALSACAAATNPVLDYGAPIGAESAGP
jgi:hypothetical protein